MVLHKFALLGGKVPAATGMRAAGRPPKAGRRTSFAAAAAPPGLRPAGCSPENPAPTGRSSFRLVFMGRCSLFAAYVFSQTSYFLRQEQNGLPVPRKGKPMDRFYPPSPPVDFWGLRRGRKVDFNPPQGQANGSILSTLAACRFWALRWGRIVPIPARARQTDGFIIPYRPVLPTAG